MIRAYLTGKVEQAVQRLIEAGTLPQRDYPQPEIADTKKPEHGDFACNFALVASKLAGLNPRTLGEALAAELEKEPEIGRVEIAGPGFVNLSLRDGYLGAQVGEILRLGSKLAQSEPAKRRNLNVEFVSVNPNGPITVGSGRGAAFGDTLCRVLQAAGHKVHREFYINDGVNSEQMRLFAASVQHFCLIAKGTPSEFPEGGYKGDYVQAVADTILAELPDAADRDVAWFQQVSQEKMVAAQREALAAFGVEFDTWFSEQSLLDAGKVDEALAKVKQVGATYESEGALWLASESGGYGDEKDRVLVRANGRPTYITSDIAYHQSKFDRGADELIDILGPDHHGYIGRMKAVIQALGYDASQLQVLIFQIVRFVKDGKPAPMRKRDGNIYALIDLIDEIGSAAAPHGTLEERRRVGADVTRFFYLMRSHDTHMDFDVDLAAKQSDENPVFYVQYAHARLCSVIDKAREAGIELTSFHTSHAGLLTHPRERDLIKKVLDLPYETARCAEDNGVHRLTTYAMELARSYHLFYDACRVVQPDQRELSEARLALCHAARLGLQGVFNLLGISAPERMSRTEA